jgi:fructooligosaccharide transport system substrate-binding protein
MVRTLKTILLLTLVISLLTGCSADIGQTSAKSAKKPRETVTMLSFPDQSKEYFEAAVANANIDFDLKIYEVPQNQYEDKVHMMLMAQESTDLILMDAPNIASYAVLGVLEPLEKYWDKNDFDDLIDTAKASVIWNGHIWAAPLNESSCLIFYNKRLFEEAGIIAPEKLEDAWDMEQLLDAAKKLTKRDKEGNIVQYGIQPSMFAINNKNEGMAYTQMLFVWWFGGDILSPDRKTATGYFDSPQSIDAIRYYGELYYKHKGAPDFEIVNGFENGKIAMWINGPWLLGIWKNNFPEFYNGGWGAMPLPGGSASASPTGSWNIAITSQSKNKDKAWQIVSAITGKEGMKIWCEGTGNIPARKSVLSQDKKYEIHPVYRLISEQLKSNSRSRPVTPAYPEISEAIVDCFNSVAHGEDVEAAVKLATQKINDALAVFGEIRLGPDGE